MSHPRRRSAAPLAAAEDDATPTPTDTSATHPALSSPAGASLRSLTVRQLRSRLDALGVSHRPHELKQALLERLRAAERGDDTHAQDTNDAHDGPSSAVRRRRTRASAHASEMMQESPPAAAATSALHSSSETRIVTRRRTRQAAMEESHPESHAPPPARSLSRPARRMIGPRVPRRQTASRLDRIDADARRAYQLSSLVGWHHSSPISSSDSDSSPRGAADDDDGADGVPLAEESEESEEEGYWNSASAHANEHTRSAATLYAAIGIGRREARDHRTEGTGTQHDYILSLLGAPRSALHRAPFAAALRFKRDPKRTLMPRAHLAPVVPTVDMRRLAHLADECGRRFNTVDLRQATATSTAVDDAPASRPRSHPRSTSPVAGVASAVASAIAAASELSTANARSTSRRRADIETQLQNLLGIMTDITARLQANHDGNSQTATPHHSTRRRRTLGPALRVPIQSRTGRRGEHDETDASQATQESTTTSTAPAAAAASSAGDTTAAGTEVRSPAAFTPWTPASSSAAAAAAVSSSAAASTTAAAPAPVVGSSSSFSSSVVADAAHLSSPGDLVLASSLRALVAVFSRPDVLGRSFHLDERIDREKRRSGSVDATSTPPAAAAAASSTSVGPTASPTASAFALAPAPVVRLGELPFDLVAIRTHFARLFAISVPAIGGKVSTLLTPHLRTLFATIWAYILDQSAAEEWLGFPVTYPTPPPTTATMGAGSIMGAPAPDHVAAFDDVQSGGRKRVRFTGREVEVAIHANATATPSAAADTSSIAIDSMAGAYLNRLAAGSQVDLPPHSAGAAAAPHTNDPLSSYVGTITAPRARHEPVPTPPTFHQLPRPTVTLPTPLLVTQTQLQTTPLAGTGPGSAPGSSMSSVASPTSTAAQPMTLALANAIALPAMAFMSPPAAAASGRPVGVGAAAVTRHADRPKPSQASAAASTSLASPPADAHFTRAAAADAADVVDLTMSDADDDDDEEASRPLPSSASTSFTQAPRLTLSMLAAHQQQQYELRNQLLHHRQLQSPSASSIRSMDAYVADYAPMIDRPTERRLVCCPQCARVNVVAAADAASTSRQAACIQCGGGISEATAAVTATAATSAPARQMSDVVPMEVDHLSTSAPAATATAATGAAISAMQLPSALPRAPASVTSERESIVESSAVVAPTHAALRAHHTHAAAVLPAFTAALHSPINSASSFAPVPVHAHAHTHAAAPPAVAAAVSLALARAPPTPLSTLLTHTFFLLLQLPQLSDPTSLLCRELWVCLGATPPDIQDEFVEFASSLAPEVARTELTRWVACAQACINKRLATFHKQDAFLRGCVKSIALFHRVNEAMRVRHAEDGIGRTSDASKNGVDVAAAAAASTVSPTSSVLDRSLFVNESIASLDLSADYRHHLAGVEAAAKEAQREREQAETQQTRAMAMSLPNAQEEEADHAGPPRKRMRGGSRAHRIVIATDGDTAATEATTASLQQYPPPPKNPHSSPVRLARHFALTSYPFLLDASSFSRLLLSESHREQRELIDSELEVGFMPALHRHHARLNPNHGALIIHVRRQYLVADTLRQLQGLAYDSDLKRPLKVVFENEEGIDAGGVKREFFSLLVRDLFSPDFNMFASEADQYVFNPVSLYSPDAPTAAASSSRPTLAQLGVEALSTLAEYELVGTILGLSIYNGVHLEVRLPTIVYKKLLAKSRAIASMVASTAGGGAGAGAGVGPSGDVPEYSLADLADSHPDLARGLQQILTYSSASPGEFEDTFGLDFTVDHTVFGATITRELVPGGAAIPVTSENRAAYVAAYVRYVLHDSIELQFDSFARGFFKVVSAAPLSLLAHPDDLRLLICGNQTHNFDDLESAATYDGWLHLTHSVSARGVRSRPSAPVIAHFWSFFHGLTPDLKLKLLAFVTGSDRIPIKGMRHAKFIIVNGGDNQEKLPESHVR